jgi:hypothetical protein
MTWRSTALLFASLLSARADTLTLRDGTTVTGTWLGAGAGQISFRVNNQVRTYPRSDVSEVIFAADEPAPPPNTGSRGIDGPTKIDGQTQIDGQSRKEEQAPKPAAKSQGTPALIKLDMTFDQVQAAMGKPAQLFDNLPGGKTIYAYKDPPVKITFKDGKVVDVE